MAGRYIWYKVNWKFENLYIRYMGAKGSINPIQPTRTDRQTVTRNSTRLVILIIYIYYSIDMDYLD